MQARSIIGWKYILQRLFFISVMLVNQHVLLNINLTPAWQVLLVNAVLKNPSPYDERRQDWLRPFMLLSNPNHQVLSKTISLSTLSTEI